MAKSNQQKEPHITRRTTIFRQLILNIVIPVVVALLVLGTLNYFHIKQVLKTSNEAANELLSQEIKSILALQDTALDIIEKPIVTRLKKYSNTLTQEWFYNTDSIETANLRTLRNKYFESSDSSLDVFVIKSNGAFVNSIGGKDLGLNFYSFGENHGKHFDKVLASGKFINGGFTIEASTKQPKIYTYQPTRDRKYIVELGISSKNANRIIQSVKNEILKLSQNPKYSVKSAKLIINADSSLFSLTKEEIEDDQKDIMYNIFKRTQRDTSFMVKEGERYFNYAYICLNEKQSGLYNYAIQIVADRTQQIKQLRQELYQSFFVFGFIILVVIFMIYNKARVITTPIKRLVDNINRIASGHFNERAAVVGNNEITKLSEHFNKMIETIEEYYNELEEKVRERTAEIRQQNEEITAQRDQIELHLGELSLKNKKLEHAYDHIEKQKRDIEDSIHYAKRIQTAILPPDPQIKNLLPDSFVLYYPKAIVSGDFYWMKHIKDKIVFAAVDCTGHGVPGAFMSMVGYSQLNNIVRRNLYKPSEVLNILNISITHLLSNKSQMLSPMRDGMDIALCSLDYDTRTLEFAGANCPLYIARKGQIIEYAADRVPIGNYTDTGEVEFTNHIIQLEPNDMIYIFSDGYRDQFGGLSGRKFLKKRFRALLSSISERPIKEQYGLLAKEHHVWRGDREQVDDILVIGVKVP